MHSLVNTHGGNFECKTENFEFERSIAHLWVVLYGYIVGMFITTIK